MGFSGGGKNWGRSLMREISALVKEGPKNPLVTSASEGTVRSWLLMNLKTDLNQTPNGPEP